MTRRIGIGKLTGNPRRISTTAAGPPVDPPIAIMLFRAAPLELDCPANEAADAKPSLPRMCVMTLILDTVLTKDRNDRSQAPSGSLPDGFSITSTAPAA